MIYHIQGNPYKTISEFLRRNVAGQKKLEWNDIFKMPKEKPCQPIILYLPKLSFRNEEQIKTFPDKQKVSEFITIRPALQEMLKTAIRVKRKGH